MSYTHLYKINNPVKAIKQNFELKQYYYYHVAYFKCRLLSTINSPSELHYAKSSDSLEQLFL